MIGENSSVVRDNRDIMNEVYLKQAYQYATQSTDPSTQNGAILIHPTKGILLGACNGLPNNIKDSPDRWERPNKYQYVEHAERNVIYKAAERGIPTQGLIMCSPWYACADCARAIIQSGIVKVIGHKNILDFVSERWQESVSIGIEMLEESGIECIYWEGNVSDNLFSIRVNSVEFYP